MPDLHIPPRPFDSARVERTFEALAERDFVPDTDARALLGVFSATARFSAAWLRATRRS